MNMAKALRFCLALSKEESTTSFKRGAIAEQKERECNAHFER
jgi:hypothetical protein